VTRAGQAAVLLAVWSLAGGPALGPATADAAGSVAHVRTARAARAPAPALAPSAALSPAPVPVPARPAAVPAGVAGGLADNGLHSPQCRRGAASAIQAGVSRDCQITGLAFAQAPIDHYSFDVYADTSLSVLGTFKLVVQEILLTPAWIALVWLVHAVAVALEWCFSIDLLDSSTAGPIATGLRSTQHAFSDPWMAAALAVAGVATAYRGLVQRRVADSLTEAAALLAMIALGLWVIADPAQTIGRLDREVNAASLGAVAAFSSGSPDLAEPKFERGLGDLFSETIHAPWCYLEFGDVGWCRERSRLDPRLRTAAQQIITRGPIAVTCGSSGVTGLVHCGHAVGDPAEAIREVALLRGAHTNGDIFLAFPNDAPLRDSLSTSGSLLTALCGSSDLATCQGATVAQAQFRGSGATWTRAGGLLFIVLGTAGMLALFAFLAFRLLGAALLTVFYLLLAPVAVLSPAFGEGGRAVFRGWAARLGGALGAKLLYSVLLGAALLMVRLLTGMSALGWWTEWLLVTAFWWLVFIHRHRLLELGTPRGRPSARAHAGEALMAGRTLGRLASGRRRQGAGRRRGPLDRVGRTGSERDSSKPPLTGAFEPMESGGSSSKDGRVEDPVLRGEQANRLLDGEHRLAVAQAQGADQRGREAAGLRERAQRLRAAASQAGERGDRRGALVSGLRASRLTARADHADGLARRAPERASRGLGLERTTGLAHDERDRTRAHSWLDAQTQLRRGVSPGPRSPSDLYRDYPRLAPLAGITTAQYAALEPGPRRRARLAVDRELARRDEPVRAPAHAGPSNARRSVSDAAGRRRRQFAVPGLAALERGDAR
jgi:hypothetical protein